MFALFRYNVVDLYMDYKSSSTLLHYCETPAPPHPGPAVLLPNHVPPSTSTNKQPMANTKRRKTAVNVAPKTPDSVGAGKEGTIEVEHIGGKAGDLPEDVTVTQSSCGGAAAESGGREGRD